MESERFIVILLSCQKRELGLDQNSGVRSQNVGGTPVRLRSGQALRRGCYLYGVVFWVCWGRMVGRGWVGTLSDLY